ncbi:MAG: helix-turn-helix domain-containing protein [Candidatus Peregrinibacteria bacterium]
MERYLLSLGFNKKEVQVYLALLEYGSQPASVIAKKINLPKATTLFLLNRLSLRGYLKRSQRGRTQYYYADPTDLQTAKEKELTEQAVALKSVVPLLSEFKNPLTSPPKIQFFEGLEGCKKAYLMILESKTDVLEFGAHDDLVKYCGQSFMDYFIHERVRRKIMLRAIASDAPGTREMQRLSKKQYREVFIFPKKQGVIYSSMVIFEDKLLLLNFYGDPFAILIQNTPVAETMKTIHRLAWK